MWLWRRCDEDVFLRICFADVFAHTVWRRCVQKGVSSNNVSLTQNEYPTPVYCTLCVMLHALCSVLRALCIVRCVSCFVLRALCFVHCASCIVLRAMCFVLRASCIVLRACVLCSVCCSLCFMHAFSAWTCVLCIVFSDLCVVHFRTTILTVETHLLQTHRFRILLFF